ncbi:hypothetical protein DFS34DRAFT_629127 [Phlyctochytrium arcticum]|nr:hypothetical protein DFS34DRAFT_629127 [Phlyctochytrium arcticum]
MDPVARSAESVNSQNHQAYPPYMDSVSSLPPMPSPIPQTAIPSNYMLGAAATRTASRSSDGPPMRGPPPTPAATSKPPSSNLPPPPMDPIPIAAQRPGPSQAVFKSPPAQPNNVFTNTPVPSVVTSSSPPTPTQVAGSPPSLASPTPPSTRTRKKVRHVQIQTRGPQTAEMETQTTLTSHTLTAQIQTLSTEASTLATKHAQTLSQLSSTTQAKEASDLQVLNLQKALDDSRAETNSLLAEVVRLRDMTRDHGREKETLQNTLQEERQRFDSLSVQAYKKIKELLMERQVLELETGTLKGQIEGLDTRHREWLEADTVK